MAQIKTSILLYTILSPIYLDIIVMLLVFLDQSIILFRTEWNGNSTVQDKYIHQIMKCSSQLYNYLFFENHIFIFTKSTQNKGKISPLSLGSYPWDDVIFLHFMIISFHFPNHTQTFNPIYQKINLGKIGEIRRKHNKL